MAEFVSLHLPGWPIQRVRREAQRASHQSPGAPASGGVSPPILLIGDRRGKRVVVRCCERSAGAGVRPGMDLAHARALLPDGPVYVQPHEPERDEAALRSLARWARRFTPIVAPDPPEGLLLEVTGCTHLFGGAEPMLRRIEGELDRLGLRAQLALAPTVGCAWAVARFDAQPLTIVEPGEIRKTLAPLPVRALRIEDETKAALAAVAIETVGELLKLPRRSLAERFGDGLLLQIDRALGQAFEGVQPMRPSAPLTVEREFAGPVKRPEAIERMASELLGELTAELEERERGLRRLVVTLQRFEAEPTRTTLTLCRPSRDAGHLERLLRPRLEQVNLGWGVERVILRAASTARLPHRQSGLDASVDEGGDADRALGELIDQLVGRLGSDRVCRAEPVETHVPERAVRFRPVDAAEPNRSEPSVVGADRPTLLFQRPERVRVMLLSPEGPVLRISRRGESHQIVRSVGPERIGPRWWVRGSDRALSPPRDYFNCQDEAGRWWWIYRAAGTDRWFCHGRWV